MIQGGKAIPYPYLFSVASWQKFISAKVKIWRKSTKACKIDIYFVVKESRPLKEIFKKFSEKYASLRYNLVHIKKSLVYFTDAENDPSPSMLKPVDWLEVKKFFEKEVVSIE
jgi:hypothetical protein